MSKARTLRSTMKRLSPRFARNRQTSREIDPQAPGLTAQLRALLRGIRHGRPLSGNGSAAQALLGLACHGNPRALHELWVLIEGRPGQQQQQAVPSLVIDDELARKILAIGRNAEDDPGLD